MSLLRIQFVRPDRLVYEGAAESIVLITPEGELGVWPGHAPLICALGSGVIRLNGVETSDMPVSRVVVSGGYAEIANDTVIVLADHARRIDDIEPKVVEETLAAAQEARDALAENDLRRAYYENKMEWCKLLLLHAEDYSSSRH